MHLQPTETSEVYDDKEWLAGNPQAAIRSTRPITIDIADFQDEALRDSSNRAVASGLPVSWKDEAAGIVKPDSGVAGEGAGIIMDPIVMNEGATSGYAHGALMTRGAVIEPRLAAQPTDAHKDDTALIEYRSI